MRISPVSQNSYTTGRRAPAFQSIIRNVKDSEGNIKNSNTTCFFRQDLHWNELATYMDNKYRNSEKVNIYSYGCSDGSEPMSMAVLLNERFKFNARKYFPIMAKDNDDFILDKIRSSCTRMYFRDIDAVIHYSQNNLGKYFVIDNQLPENESMIVHPSYETKSKIRYSKADVIKDVLDQLNTAGIPSSVVELTPRVKELIMIAGSVAKRTRSAYISSEHLLVALLSQEESFAINILAGALKLNVYEMRNRAIALITNNQANNTNSQSFNTNGFEQVGNMSGEGNNARQENYVSELQDELL